MAARDDEDHDARVERLVAQHRAEQAFLDERDAKERLAESARANADAERAAKAALAVAATRRPTPSYRSSYTGPVRDRQKIDGKAIVSREELADFQKRFGADKTLRDLLNADRTGKLPAPVTRGNAAAAAPMSLRSLLGTKESAAPATEDAAERLRRLPAMKSPEEERDEAKNRTMAALSLLGGAGANVGLRALAGRAAAGRAAPAARNPLVREAEDIPAFKKGGKVKAYAKGGSVRGAGCETRHKKTKYV